MKYSSITTHTGDMRCHTLLSPSQSSFNTDVDVEHGGMGQYPNPAEMLAASVASCMLSAMAYTGKRHDFDTKGISVAATAAETGGHLTTLKFLVNVPMAVSEGTKKHLLAAAESCPVGKALAIEKEISWEWAERSGCCCAH